MLKKITILVMLIVFAKPAYDLAMKFLDEPTYIEDAILPVSKQSLLPQVDVVSETTLPNIVKSVEDLADAFFYYFSRFETDFTIQYVGSTSDIGSMLTQATAMAAARNDYIGGHLGSREMEYEYGLLDAEINVSQDYLTNHVQEQAVAQKVAALISPLNISAMTDFEKVKFVNDTIVKNTVYSENTEASAHSAYAIAYENKGVCQGYALFALKLLQALGVEARYVTGEVYSGGHAWNLVKVDGAWYHLDTTWNDPVPDRGQGVRYSYFLASDAQMKQDHVWLAENYPQATSQQYTFMHVVQDSYEKEGYVYYSHSGKDNVLYRLNMKTGDNAPLTKSRALYITGYGEWLYFSNYSNSAYLTKIRLDGSEETVLYKEEVKSLFVEEGLLYFTTNDGLKEMSIK